MKDLILLLLIAVLILPLYIDIYFDKIFANTIYLVDENKSIKVNNTDFYIKDKVSCKSDSMGLIINCKDTMFTRLLTDNETLVEGRIYIYKKDGVGVAHRLVKDCVHKICWGYIFKGDNNYVADTMVKRGEVLREVKQIAYD